MATNNSTQLSLDYLDISIIIKRRHNGSWTVVDELPNADGDHVTLSETDTETAKPGVTYPRERDYCTVKKYKRTKTFRHQTSVYTSEYKLFDIGVDRSTDPDMADRLSQLATTISALPTLKQTVNNISSYDDLLDMSDTVRKYEATYELLMGIWAEDSLQSYAIRRTARDFEINQLWKGFFLVPGPHHDTVSDILADKLQDEDCGQYSVPWGGFIVEPEDFSAAYDILAPVYHTPDVADPL